MYTHKAHVTRANKAVDRAQARFIKVARSRGYESEADQVEGGEKIGTIWNRWFQALFHHGQRSPAILPNVPLVHAQHAAAAAGLRNSLVDWATNGDSELREEQYLAECLFEAQCLANEIGEGLEESVAQDLDIRTANEEIAAEQAAIAAWEADQKAWYDNQAYLTRYWSLVDLWEDRRTRAAI